MSTPLKQRTPKSSVFLGTDDSAGMGRKTWAAERLGTSSLLLLVGNYGEIFERNLTPLGLSHVASTNLGHRAVLLYAIPFR